MNGEAVRPAEGDVQREWSLEMIICNIRETSTLLLLSLAFCLQWVHGVAQECDCDLAEREPDQSWVFYFLNPVCSMWFLQLVWLLGKATSGSWSFL